MCHCVMFGDAAMNVIRYRGGGGCFVPKLSGIHSQVVPPERHTQQSAELWVLVWLVQLAVRPGCCYVILVTDSQVAACHFFSRRASTWLNRQQPLLCALVLQLRRHPLIVEVRLVPGYYNRLTRQVGWIRIISRVCSVCVARLIACGGCCFVVHGKCNSWVVWSCSTCSFGCLFLCIVSIIMPRRCRRRQHRRGRQHHHRSAQALERRRERARLHMCAVHARRLAWRPGRRIWLGTQARLVFDGACQRDDAPRLLELAAKDLGQRLQSRAE